MNHVILQAKLTKLTMKKTLLTIIYLLILPLLVLSQDIIIKTSRDSIKCMVTEVNDEEVLYKIWGQTYGPGYSIPESKVYKIEFRLGHELVFNDTLTSKLENEQIPLTYHPWLFKASDRSLKKYFRIMSQSFPHNFYVGICHVIQPHIKPLFQ